MGPLANISIFLLLLLAANAKIVSRTNHECARECQPNVAKVCSYNFTVEWYRTLSRACYNCPTNLTDCDRPHCITGDGMIRGVLSINRQMPGPTIEVCEGDTVEVWVKNAIDTGEGIGIHWHGLHMRGTPHMDGVALLTQCPINPMATFKYTFKATPSGTHWYHSHSGIQREDGLIGALIVKQPRQSNPHAGLYDHDLSDHVIMVKDWEAQPGINELMDHLHGTENDPDRPISSIVNGKNRLYSRPGGATSAKTPLEVFHVEQGKRYRFRLIHAGGKRCAYKVSVDNHNLTVISLDGSNVKPVEVDTFAIFAGESYDFILTANQSVDNYWLRGQGFQSCKKTPAHVHAILRYKGARDEDPKKPYDLPRAGRYLNPMLFDTDKPKPGAKHGEPYDISIMDLESTDTVDLTNQKADVTFYTGIDLIWNDNVRSHHPKYYPAGKMDTMFRFFSPLNDNISYIAPPVPLLSQPEDVKPEWLCNKSTVNMDKCYTDGCRCTHVVNFKYKQIVDVVTVNEGFSIKSGGHPMHLHGYSFRLLAHTKVNNSLTVAMVKEMYESGNISMRLTNPILKDTIDVPDGGYVIFRFTADNPGYWFYHCHVESHILRGNGLVFKVGEQSQMAPNPPNFPRCGGWGYEGAPNYYPKSSVTSKPCTTSSSDIVYMQGYKLLCVLLFWCTLLR